MRIYTSIGAILVLIDEIKLVAQKERKPPIGELEIIIKGKTKSGSEKNVTDKIKIYNPSHFQKIIEFKRESEAALNILHDTAIQQLVNSWESLLANIITIYYQYNEDKISKDKTLNYNQILQFTSLDEIKKTVIDKEVRLFLEKSPIEQLSELNKLFGIDFRSQYSDYELLIELILIRHLIVHCGGIVNNDYLNKVKNLGNRTFKELEVGKRLQVSAKYIIDSWGRLYAAGVILTHLIVSQRCPHQNEENDNSLNNAAYHNIKHEQLKSALYILEYAEKRTIKNTKIKWILKLNLAQTFNKLGKITECQELLNGSEWKVASSKFQLCVNSINENTEEFERLLVECAEKKEIQITDLYEWPIFDNMRKHECFKSWIEKAFGYQLSEFRSLQDHKIIDCDLSNTMKMLLNYFDEKKKILISSSNKTRQEK